MKRAKTINIAKDQSQAKDSQKSKRISAVISFALVAVLGFIIWITILWHKNGIQEEIFGWNKTSKAYLEVLYNLALMVATGTTAGILAGKISQILGKSNRKKRLPDEGNPR